MENLNLYHRIHLNLAETLREIARRSGGQIHEYEGVLLYAAAPSDPVLWNGVVRLEPRHNIATILTLADAFFSELGRGYTLWTFSHLDKDLDQELKERESEPSSIAPQMILDEELAEPNLPAGIQIRSVAGHEEYDDAVAVLGAAFEPLGVDSAIWRMVYPDPASMAAEDLITKVLYVDGTAAATGMVYVSHSVAEIMNVGTHPEFRRQGLGSLVTHALTTEGFNRSVMFASLQSTPMGLSVYRNLGYREVGQYRWYIIRPRT